jgi:hypothetical protein
MGQGSNGKGSVSAFRHRSAAAPRAALWAAVAFAGASPARAAEDLSTWAHYENLYFDTSPNGADISGPVRDFPVLIRLRAANFPFAQALGGGQDLRFARPDGTPLRYEIERWDSAHAAADVWVRVDSIPGNAQGTLARMYWGKPGSASLSDGNAVFNPLIGFDYVWHLGGPAPSQRPNSVGGKPAAAPVNYDNDESREGIGGLCDSLDGKSPGDYLDLGDGFTEFSGGLTISLWANPARVSIWGRFIDIGNGAGVDNILLMRRDNSQDLVFKLFGSSGQTLGSLTAPGAIALDQWQFFAVTLTGTTASLYRNGVLVASGSLSSGVSNVKRINAFAGHSNWASDEYYGGKLDEVEMSHVARPAIWFKLAYANQKADQKLIGFSPPSIACTPKFGAPADTALPEASLLELAGTADCATSYQWSVVSGPGPRILDPEVKLLQVPLPRVLGDTSILYRFTAVIGGSARTRDVLVHVKEAIPEPVFTLADLSWNGKDSLLVQPVIQNMPSLVASPEPGLHYAWSLSGGTADTAWRRDGLLLRSAPDRTLLRVGLCLDNNGPQVCRAATVGVGQPVGLAPLAPRARGGGGAIRRDARGRRLREVRSLPAFPLPGR